MQQDRDRVLFRLERNLLAAVVALLAVGCGGGGGGGLPGTSGDFIVLRTTPNNNGRLFLNESVTIDFSNAIDVDSADFNAVSFAVFDLNGNQLAEPVQGTFRVSASTGDAAVGRRLEFQPKFPLSDSFDDGGFRPGRRYVLQVVKGDHRRNVGLLDESGRGLQAAFSFTFSTADGTTPSQLFKDTKVGGPVHRGFEVSPRDPQTAEVALNELGQAPTEVRLRFDQPLNPHSTNVPFRIDLSPARRLQANRGRIYLQYDDPAAPKKWIPASVILEQNTLDGSVVVLRPFGVLPNNATIEVVVESTLQDMSGESNVNDAQYEPIFARFATDSSYALRFDALVENFLTADRLDLTAAFEEPLAEIGPGKIRANFEFEGGRQTLDYRPTSTEVVLDTDFTQITPHTGTPFNVSGGVFRFRNVLIDRGVTVRGAGSNPMVWLVTGDFTVGGSLLIEGGDGERVNAFGSANFPTAGGVATCGGGNGGLGSPNSLDRSPRGGNGAGAFQLPSGGGEGGRLSCSSSCNRGSGGGGGSHATQGDPYYKLAPTNFVVQPKGIGGYGCGAQTTTLPGGAPGPVVFTDPRPDNDFWGAAVDRNRGIRITGELARSLGGQGGGGGGDRGPNCSIKDPNYINDDKGGGGGGGGGILIVKALGNIIVEETGLISAGGGDGGGGAWAGASSRGGGGGGGAGGTVVLMAGESIRIEAHGETYANDDASFPVSADGGVGLLSSYHGKYPTASGMNSAPSGGMGGLGIIQLMAPPGSENVDGTNTLLDENIFIIKNGNPLTGGEKQRYLAWRGMPDANGTMRDDDGDPVTIGKNEGDMRPSPLLMPAPFGTRSRARSKWIDLGAVDRRNTVAGGDGLPRGVEQQGSLPIGTAYGPLPEFADVRPGGSKAGFVQVRDDNLGGVVIDHELVAAGLEVASVVASASFRGSPAIEVRLAQPNAVLGATPHRYSHYRASLAEGPTPLGEFRILGHTDSVLYLSSELDSLENIPATSQRNISLDVRAKFFDIFTGDVPGFPDTFIGRGSSNPRGVRIPRSNVRIGFAFHQDPANPSAKRYPANPRAFFFDWSNPSALEDIRKDHYRFVQYDILFDTQFEDADPPEPGFENTNSLSPETPRPEVRRLVLPYRY